MLLLKRKLTRNLISTNNVNKRVYNFTKNIAQSSSLSPNDRRHYDAKKVNKWARSNQDLAKRALIPPPVPQSNCCSKFETLESYLNWRGWSNEYIQNQNTLALLSHALTFPLTLANYIVSFDTANNVENVNGEKTNASICCIGARAESNLSDEYWKEFLIYLKARRQCTKNWSIDFIGPDILTQQTSRKIHLHNEEPSSPSLTLHYHKSYFHNYIITQLEQDKKEKIMNKWNHGFVLFNPGIGHPNLSKLWEPTIKYILQSKRSFLFTSHSELDRGRDEQKLNKIMKSLSLSIPIENEVNPFASKMVYKDPLFDASKNNSGHEIAVHWVSPNVTTTIFKKH